MSKNRKTRQQKIISKLRQKLQSSTPQLTSQAPDQQNNIPELPKQHSSLFTYATSVKKVSEGIYSMPKTSYFVKQDLSRTILLTFSIAVFELLILFAFKKHIFTLPMISY